MANPLLIQLGLARLGKSLKEKKKDWLLTPTSDAWGWRRRIESGGWRVEERWQICLTTQMMAALTFTLPQVVLSQLKNGREVVPIE